jgi:DNA polymerase III subunit beta
MKAECLTEKLRRALSIVEKITGKNLSLPVLKSILWIFKEKKLKLRATNLNLGIEFNIPAKVEKEGVVAIKGEVLSQLFSFVDKDQNTYLEIVNDNLLIKNNKNKFILKTVPYDDFPTIPIVKGESFYLQSEKLLEGLRSVYYSAATSEIKPEIGSVYIYSEDDTLFFVSTDSFRLAEKKIKIKQKIKIDGLLIPAKNVAEIIRVFENVNEEIKITIQKNQISFENEEIYLTSRVVDGLFPDYKQIIPKQPSTKIIVLKQDLLSAIKLSNIFSDKKFNQINFLIKTNDKIFELSAQNSDVGENNTQISGVLEGEDVSLSFNYKYLLDCFQSIQVDSISLEFSGNNKPVILKPVGDNSFLYLVMPMNR